MIDNLPALVTFTHIVSAGSLSAAARELDLPLSVISKRLAQLETSVGIRLIQRTTRRQTLTEEGVMFHARVLRILDEIEQAEAMLSHRRQEVSGLLRVTAPGEFGRQRIVPIIADFQRLHPQLTVQLELTDTLVDLLESGFDMAIRFGDLADSSLIARRLASNYRIACAAPAYLDRYAIPTHPTELNKHRCILIGTAPRADWRFEKESGESVTVRVTGSIITNDGEAAHRLALEGAGIVVKSIWDVNDNILGGRLQRVLPQYAMPTAPLHAIFPHNRNLAPRVRTFIDYVQDRLQQMTKTFAEFT